MTAILGLDQGTTGSTAIMFAQDGTVLGRGYREIPQHFPAPGWVEHDGEDLFQLSVEAMREAIEQAGVPPVALGITNQRETVLLWDRKTLCPVSAAIVWQDRRTADRCRELTRLGHAPMLRARTGLVPDPYFSATKIEWLLRDPGLRKRAELGDLAVGTVDSWLVAKLTGGQQHVTDPTNASRTMLFDHVGGVWHDELLDLFGVPRTLLPRIVPSGGYVGEVHAKHLGLPVPISGMAGDQQAALFAHGCTKPGLAKTTYGTGAFSLVYAGTQRPGAADGVLVTAAVGPDGGRAFAIEGSVFIAGAAVQWLRDGLGIVAEAAETDALARSVPDTGGVTLVPAFAGLGTPHWEPEARGMITGITRGTTRAHIVRATLEAMALSVADLLRIMPTGMGALNVVRVDGGAAANDWLLQFQADILGVPVERPQMVEATCFGAAALAGLGLSIWPGPEHLAADRMTTRFVPQMDEAVRAAKFREWKRAVDAALAWARTR